MASIVSGRLVGVAPGSVPLLAARWQHVADDRSQAIPPVFPSPSNSGRSWSTRWLQLARAAGIDPRERLLLGLSGGADSVLLLHLLAESVPRPDVRAVHVDHGLRGEESSADARFCGNLCRALGVPFTLRTIELDQGGPSPEARAREERYRALTSEARSSGHRTILTGHHSDDALETLLWRWTRGTSLPGLRGPRRSIKPHGKLLSDSSSPGRDDGDLRVVRPLLSLRREEVRRLLADRGLRWREDSSNADPRHTRSRVRHGLVPWLHRLCGDDGIENLRAFGRAVERLEENMASATAHVAWSPAPYAAASRGPDSMELGGVVQRAELMAVATPLRRRALWRLLTEGIGLSPGRALLEHVLDDLAVGRCRRHALPGDWTLLMRSNELHLLPPRPTTQMPATEQAAAQALLPFPTDPAKRGSSAPWAPNARPDSAALAVPGIVTLPDGRRVSAERVRVPASIPASTDPLEVELDAEGMPASLSVRWPAPGDRFHALGAPGSKPLLRFLADRGVPREERASVPVVAAGDEIVWVAGVEPGERHRIRARTSERLRLTLHHSARPAPHTAAPDRRGTPSGDFVTDAG